MLCQMKLAARSSRVMEAPTENDFGPHSAGLTATPWPSGPWQTAHFSLKIASPRDGSPVSLFGIPSSPSTFALVPTGMPFDR